MAKKVTTKNSSSSKIPSAKSMEQNATRADLFLVREELKAQISGVENSISGGESRLGAQITRLEAKISDVESQLKAFRFDMNSQFDRLDAMMLRMFGLIEEQRSDNRIVLEGYQLLSQRMVRVETHTGLK